MCAIDVLFEVIFVELKPFERHRESYFSDDEYKAFQQVLLNNPKAGDVIPGSGGLRKVRHKAKGKGQRGGVRVIYYHWTDESLIYLFTVYDHTVRDDLSSDERKTYKAMLEVMTRD